MRAYMVFAGEPKDGAFLVFAHNVKEAKRVGFSEVVSWFPDGEYIDLRATWLKGRGWLFEQADKAKLAADIPHIIDDPIHCKSCELWGMKLNSDGYCEDCECLASL